MTSITAEANTDAKPEAYALDFRTPTEAGILPTFVEQLLFKQAKDIARNLGEPRPQQKDFTVKTADAVSDDPGSYVRNVTIITTLSREMREALVVYMLDSGYLIADNSSVLTLVLGESSEVTGKVREAV